MLQQLKDSATLSNGIQMPWIGLGSYKMNDGDVVESSVKHAIHTGYRSIDTAAFYGNEEGIGKAVKESGVSREELFITTKVWNTNQGYEPTLQAFEESRKKLGLEYLDLYLIHWPVKGQYKETWRAIEHLYKEGFARAIGVCNFKVHHLKDLVEDCSIMPMVNQVEFHPLLSQKEVLSYCKENRIQLEAWSPLMQGNLDIPLLNELSEKYGKSPAQIVLRWDLQHGVVTIPKTVTPRRIEENADIFDFELSSEDMDKIDSLNQNKRFGPDPDNF